jgi:hypothetical protein
MIKLIIPKHGSNAIKLNTETLEIGEMCSYNTNIDYAYSIDEDCEITFDGKTYPVLSGDIIFKMYGFNNERTLIIIKSKELFDYNKAYDVERKLQDAKYGLNDRGLCCNECVSVA